MPHSTTNLTSDEIDDLVYFSRVGDLDSLKESLESHSKTHSCPIYSIITAAIDVDEEGLGSGSCLLHYPAANGNLEIVTYLLALTGSNSELPTASTGQNDAAKSPQSTPSKSLAPASNFVNHQNVSGNTPLHWAGMNGRLAIVQALIRAGADPEIVNGAGRDAVVESEWSSKDGAAECAVWILKECDALEKGVGESVQEGEDSAGVDEDADTVVENSDDVASEQKKG